jgi:hypothetical protein
MPSLSKRRVLIVEGGEGLSLPRDFLLIPFLMPELRLSIMHNCLSGGSQQLEELNTWSLSPDSFTQMFEGTSLGIRHDNTLPDF